MSPNFSWWKLGALWLLSLKGRTPAAKRALVGHSVKLAWVGLALGLAALSLTLAIVSGFEYQLAKVVAQTGGDVLHQNAWSSFQDLQKRVELAPPAELERLEVFWNTPALVVGKSGGKGVPLEAYRSFDDKAEFLAASFDRLGMPLNQVAVSDEDGLPKVELGSALAKFLGVEVGDQIRLLLPGVTQASLNLEVASIKSLGLYDLEARWMRTEELPLRKAILKLDPGRFDERAGDAHGIRYFFDESWRGPEQKSQVAAWVDSYEAQLNQSDDLQLHDPFVRAWFEQKQNLFGSIGMDKVALSVILALLCLVAALNVAAALVILFLERDKEISLLRAIGMSRQRLMGWVLSQGVLMGIASVALAAIFSFILGQLLLSTPWAQIPEEIYNLSTLPLRFVWQEQLAVAIFGVFASCFFSFWVALGLVWSPHLNTLRHR